MVGGVSGYYEPEWDEETAWGALVNWVYGQFFAYNPNTDEAYCSRKFSGVAAIFRAADELLSEAN